MTVVFSGVAPSVSCTSVQAFRVDSETGSGGDEQGGRSMGDDHGAMGLAPMLAASGKTKNQR